MIPIGLGLLSCLMTAIVFSVLGYVAGRNDLKRAKRENRKK